jgi:two-component system sensor histidine kinase UhpB
MVLVALVLGVCLLLGGVLTYWTSLRKVETEMSSAIEVGNSTVGDALASIAISGDPLTYLQRVIGSFDGDRHVVARLVAPDGTTKITSRLEPPRDPPPHWLHQLFAGNTYIKEFSLPAPYKGIGTVELQSDSHNEVGEVWEDLKLKFIILAGFCATVLVLIYASLGRALKPLEDLSAALNRVGEGDYTAHVAEQGPEDLNMIYRAFNRMAERLQAAELQNRRLNEQLSTVQEEERSEVARDLHDEIGPFLFAVDVDAQSIPALLSRDAGEGVERRVSAIRQSVHHMQMHLRAILSRLRPAMMIDQGLTHAVEQLIAFWRARRPNITFHSDISEARFPAHIEETAFRIFQEGTSNAVRHGKPDTIELSAQQTETGHLRIVVSDDGQGIAEPQRRGFGLVGMGERVAALNGTMKVTSHQNGKGVILVAEIPLPPERRGKTEETPKATSTA